MVSRKSTETDSSLGVIMGTGDIIESLSPRLYSRLAKLLRYRDINV